MLRRVAGPPPLPKLAERADLEHFKGVILNTLWRAELSRGQRSIFVAVLFCFLTHLAYNAWGGWPSVINDTVIWTATEAVRSACQDWLANPWVSLPRFVAMWEDLVEDAVVYTLHWDPEIPTSMPYWLDWRASATTTAARPKRQALDRQ
ncbi:hypothetical protein EMIHUDRAFT_224635 [Emiliania huxleyi CCMP1516]|uniref:Uncharacterized protein n=2 Tax=Emiliania huxleyi TaxID=2903 RepID=A0A0D3KRX1_EMIH1|nr:hypothetical protein EMIHUDRAFT_224635 [Emiliania huxleyi CCMP1516]EOD38506.1 hypothetical protein EMIHUDRAFT_224635 [Emiliania huxleyi CCMP1516]|eukprot:XP_005790935.1 hypothetical protein EMIHUDRAFT_224635 [Emiliania huxleyi CCMP1516]